MSLINNQHKQEMPKIRFKGFNSEYITMPISEAVREVKRPLSMDDATEYQLITVKRRNEGIVSRGGYNGSEILVKNQFIVEENDFIISKRQVVHGATGLLPKTLAGSIVSNEYLVLEGSNKLDINYFALKASLPRMRHQFYLSSYGIDIEKLFFDVKDWYRRTIALPDLKEQTQIGNLFQQLDKLIELQTRAVESSELYKKAMLQKMFPQKGEKAPRVRFEGFSGDWSEFKIGNITSSYSGGTPSVTESNYYNGDIPFIRSGEINSKETELFITELGLKNSSAKMVEQGDILYALYGATSGEVSRSKIKGAINQAILAIKPRAQLCLEYLCQLLGFMKDEIVGKYLQGGQGNLSGAIIKDLKIALPDLKEQREIGKFFQKLDQNIEAEKQKLEKYQDMKKAMLQRMFV